MGADQFGVEIEEGHLRTGHLVTVADTVVERLRLGEGQALSELGAP
jgi:hypothetical protein